MLFDYCLTVSFLKVDNLCFFVDNEYKVCNCLIVLLHYLCGQFAYLLCTHNAKQ